MLEDRLLEGINLYKNNVSNKIIMSGDHGRAEYDEVNIMKNYAIERGVKNVYLSQNQLIWEKQFLSVVMGMLQMIK